MPTLTDQIRKVEGVRDDARQRREVAERQAQTILDGAQQAGRSHLNADEDARIKELFEARDAATIEARNAVRDLEELRDVEREESERQRQAGRITPTSAARSRPSYDKVHRVGTEARTYQPPEASRDGRGVTGPSFLRDLYMSQVRRDPAAGERLARHGREVETEDPGFHLRAVNTGAVSGFVPPQYLADLFAEYARAGRPAANLCTPMPLPPEGMTIDVPRVTTPTTTAVQASENATVSNQDADDTLLAVPVVTVAGYVDTSRQSIERGVMVEEVLFADLAASYASSLDTQVINGSGSSGQHLGLLNVSGVNTITYTDATPTIPELWPKLADAAGKVMSQRFTGPTAFVMTPTAWAWILAEKDTTGRPLVEPQGVAMNPAAISTTPDYSIGSAGSLFGVPVVLDGNIPANLGAGTNETRIIGADFRDVMLFEDGGAAPAQLRFDEPLSSSLGVRLVAYGYSALASGRQPKAVSVISGTGLIVPAL